MAYISLLDMFDGGGAGASGSEFKGGPISGLLNRIGVKPHGYRDRTASMGSMPPMQTRRGSSVPTVAVSSIPTAGLLSPADAFTRKEPMLDPVLPPMAYSGRGYVGMPIQPELQQDEYAQALEYLRQLGQVNY